MSVKVGGYVYSDDYWVCRWFGHKVTGYGESTPYGRVTDGYTDGIGREHWTVERECDRCGKIVDIGRFHGPLPKRKP